MGRDYSRGGTPAPLARTHNKLIINVTTRISAFAGAYWMSWQIAARNEIQVSRGQFRA
jgi:hypothetical protein